MPSHSNTIPYQISHPSKHAMLAMLFVCAMCARQSVQAFSLKQKNSVDSAGVLSNTFLVPPPLATMLRSKASELPPSQVAIQAIKTAAANLEGYIHVKRSFSDLTCQNWDYFSTQQLNSCHKEEGGEYTRITATSTNEANQNTYTDSKCATTPKSQETIVLGDCTLGMSYAYSSTKVLTSSRPFLKVL